MNNSIKRTGYDLWTWSICLIIFASKCDSVALPTSRDTLENDTINCPSECRCDTSETSDLFVICIGGSVLSLDQLPIDVTRLTIRNYNFSFDFAHIISRFDRLAILELTNSTNVDHLLEPVGLHLRFLDTLILRDNGLERIPNKAFAGCSRMTSLDISGNRLTTIDTESLYGLASMRSLDLSRNRISTIKLDAFRYSTGLEQLHLSHNSIAFVQPGVLDGLTALLELDLTRNNLTILHPRTFISQTHSLQRLSISDNPIDPCDCHMAWLVPWLRETGITIDIPSALATPCPSRPTRPCTPATISNGTAGRGVVTRLGATALLECRATGNPAPALTWILPRNHHVFHLYPPTPPTYWHFPYQPNHPLQHPATNSSDPLNPNHNFARRIRVLRNGNLFISRVHQVDAGTYKCLATNALSNDTITVTLSLNYQILVHVKVMSILVGVATSIALLLVLLVFRLVNMAVGRWGCCCSCCQTQGSSKARQIRKLLETVETYRSQQLERLRDNYAMQVNRIKDNCAQQMDRIRESYGSQVDRLRDIRDFGTLQIDRVREQYCEQVKRVRDYSSSQISRVRENYVFQRTRIRKFSAHHMIRFRENYKLQQLHLNKILETLNIESCRTGCSRSESMDFGPDPSTVFAVHLDRVHDDDQSDTYFTPEDSSRPQSPAENVPEVTIKVELQPEVALKVELQPEVALKVEPEVELKVELQPEVELEVELQPEVQLQQLPEVELQWSACTMADDDQSNSRETRV